MISLAVLTQITGVTSTPYGSDSDGPDFDGPGLFGSPVGPLVYFCTALYQGFLYFSQSYPYPLEGHGRDNMVPLHLIWSLPFH